VIVSKPFTSVWTREPRQPRSSGLGREQIVAGALELLDAEGLDALSMRKLGAKLGAGATSLYWYVANKDELLELVMDEIWAMVEVPGPEHASWREAFTTFAYSLRATLTAHPWAVPLLGQLPNVGPKSFALMERLRRAAAHAGFAGIDNYLATGTVMSFVFGQVIPQVRYENSNGGKKLDYGSLLDTVDQLAADYPQLLADYHETMPPDPATARALAFDFGLLCVLDGLAARMGAAAEPGRAASAGSGGPVG
jgi:AcrR family transcriptional regulator